METTTLSFNISANFTTARTEVLVVGETGNSLEALKANVNDFFLIICGIIIFSMQLGFALLEAGAVRVKNTTNILIKNLLDCLLAGIAYWLFGYAFAYGDGNSFIGYTHFATSYLLKEKLSHWFFHYVFAAAAASIVSGSLAERCSPMGYFAYSFFLSAFVYPVVTRWAWYTTGWLQLGNGEIGYRDFAGSGCVHVVGGTCALVGAVLLGPRIGRFDKTGDIKEIRGHSVPLTFTGGMILLIGFLAFNGGSQASISAPGDGTVVATAVVNSVISACFAGFTTLLLVRVGMLGEPLVLSGLHSLNGALTGMVAICAGCNDLYPWGAAVIGGLAGVCYLTGHIITLKLRIDDPLDAIAVHLGGGLLGVIGFPFLSITNGIFLTGTSRSGKFLAWNIAGALSISCWTACLSLLLFGTMKTLNILRIESETEVKGLDIIKHNEPAYPRDP